MITSFILSSSIVSIIPLRYSEKNKAKLKVLTPFSSNLFTTGRNSSFMILWSLKYSSFKEIISPIYYIK